MAKKEEATAPVEEVSKEEKALQTRIEKRVKELRKDGTFSDEVEYQSHSTNGHVTTVITSEGSFCIDPSTDEEIDEAAT